MKFLINLIFALNTCFLCNAATLGVPELRCIANMEEFKGIITSYNIPPEKALLLIVEKNKELNLFKLWSRNGIYRFRCYLTEDGYFFPFAVGKLDLWKVGYWVNATTGNISFIAKVERGGDYLYKAKKRRFSFGKNRLFSLDGSCSLPHIIFLWDIDKCLIRKVLMK